MNPAQSYLFGILFWSDLPFGALAFLMLLTLTGGAWGAATRRVLEALADTLLPIALLFIPVLLLQGRIYPWTSAELAAAPKIAHKSLYLNPLSFAARAAFYFASWHWLRRRAHLPKAAAGGLVLFGFTMSFAAIDWQMSVEPEWYSTVYGLLFLIGQALSAYSFALIVFGFTAPPDLPDKTLRDVANILLTLVAVWTYLAFMQYLIVWTGNLPHEVTWYAHRSSGGWQWLALALAVFQFAAPFVILLFRAAKRGPRRLAALGALVFAARAIDHYFMLAPGFRPERGFELPWHAVALWLAIGAVWLFFFRRRLSHARA